jgi:SAM-dependent methyltransferase
MDASPIDSASTLRPTEAQALEAWRVLVAGERQQVERLPNRPRPADFYAPIAQSFRDDPRRTDDPALDLVLAQVKTGETWLDLGAGAGRFALPIALRARRVFAVEPSAGMVAALRESMQAESIENIDVFAERWPGPTAIPPADVGFIGHVGYDIEAIGPFLDQLERYATRLCAALLFVVSPTSDFAPLWQAVHGEERVTLPGLRELSALLYARGRRPETHLIELPPRVFKDLESLQAAARRPTWVLPDSEQDEKLKAACKALAVGVEGEVALSTETRALGLITWRPPEPR